MPQETPQPQTFAELGLSDAVMQAVVASGYEQPSPIQAATIPALLAGRDVLGQAQTGTGKTAAFAMPALSKLDLAQKQPQVLVLAPTRELAIQVAEAFQSYAKFIPGFQVLPIYGGQGYGPQLAALKRGVHVVVGTPGRVIDHLERGTLKLNEIKMLILDEADEMLRMGFIDDVETVLKKIPQPRQVALFSATMPPQIGRIAQTYQKDPVVVKIAAKTSTATNIRQRFWWVSGVHKLDALTRILEAEPFDAMIIFARTKAATEELAQKLQARGVAAAAINGDMQQVQRERAVNQLKDGKLDVLVATDVAARGLDVERISHVLNYDIPYDTESYVHRIGRTGRAGRSGEAILFVTPREKGMLRSIERATRQEIEEMTLPTVDTVNDQRVVRFMDRISKVLAVDEGQGLGPDLGIYRDLVQRYEQENDVPMVEVAAALAHMLQGNTPFLLSPEQATPRGRDRDRDSDRGERRSRGDSREAPRGKRGKLDFGDERPAREPRAPRPPREASEEGMETFRIDVGHVHGVKPSNIVGAVANEAGLESRYIGRIEIHDDYSTLDLPSGMPADLLTHLKKVWVSGQQLNMRRDDGGAGGGGGGARPPRRSGPGGGRPGGGRPGGSGAPRKKGGGSRSGIRPARD